MIWSTIHGWPISINLRFYRHFKIFKIPYYGFTMLSLDLEMNLCHICISDVSAKFLGKDLLGQYIFLSIRYFKRFRDLLKQVVTFDAVKKILRDRRSKTYEQTAPKVSRGTLHGTHNPIVHGLFYVR